MRSDDLARPGPPAEAYLNYLHFGDSLETLVDLLARTEAENEADVASLITKLRCPRPGLGRGVADATDVLRALTCNGDRLTFSRIRRDLEMSLQFRQIFRSLSCRGFSFRLREDPHFRNCGFSSEVSLKVALIADRGLYYPPNVRQGLSAAESQNRHITHSIGWLIIIEKMQESQRWWYVANVQSDLTSAPVSCVRDVFRGWQRVLFLVVIELARQRGVTAIAIPSSSLMAELGNIENVARRRDRAWRGLYDGVANFFAMAPTQQPCLTNVQPVWFTPPAWCSRFYVGDVSTLIESFSSRCCEYRNGEQSAAERVASQNDPEGQTRKSAIAAPAVSLWGE
jgi:hypothetical protein